MSKSGRSADELLSGERRHWVWGTPLGKIFVMGVALAFVVGVVFVYQVMASDVGSRLGEFATLKAMGYGDAYISRVVLRQALLWAWRDSCRAYWRRWPCTR